MVKKSELNYTKESQGGWDQIIEILISWKENGLIKILKYPEDLDDNDFCIQILKFLDGEDFPSNWIRDSVSYFNGGEKL